MTALVPETGTSRSPGRPWCGTGGCLAWLAAGMLVVTHLTPAAAEPRPPGGQVVADWAADEVTTRLYERDANGDIVERPPPSHGRPRDP